VTIVLRLALFTVLTVAIIGSWGCGDSGPPAYDRLVDLHEQLTCAPVPLPDELADQIESESVAALSEMANSSLERNGKPESVVGANLTFKIATVYLHRYDDARRAKALMFAARDIFKELGTPSALRTATVLERKINIINKRFAGDHLGRGDNAAGGDDAHVAGVQN